MLLLKNLKRLKKKLSSLSSKEDTDALIKDLIAACAKCGERLGIQSRNFKYMVIRSFLNEN